MAAPELRLEVSLNLAGFRAEVKKLTNIAQSEFTPKINVKFNRSTLNQELNNLQAAIKRRTYRIEIGGNIDKLPDKIKDLKEQLASLESFKVDLGIGAVKSLSKQDAKKIKNDLRAEILGEQKKIYVPLSIKPAITRQDVRDFKNAVQSKLTGLTVKVKADLEAASISSGAKSQSDIDADVRRGLQAISEIGAARMAKGAGGITEPARREQLKQALSQGGFDIAALKDIGKQLGVSGVGRFKRIDTLINKIVADASIEMVKKYLDPQAVMRNTDRSALGKVLDTFARGIFNMLGMDPASIRAQQAERRRIPSISWQASVPPQGGFGGPSSTGRALPPGVTPMGLPGTAFASQKRLVGDILSPSLKDALRGAANAFVDSVRRELNNAVRSVSVKDLGSPVRAALSAGASGRSPLMLPPAGGTGANRVRITTGSFTGRGYEPPGGFPSDGRLGGKQGPSTFIGAGSQMEKFKTVLDVASASTRNFRASQIPLIGGLKELGGEFGLAAKQVLLYGTAYKGLAFITGLPGQMLNAAKSQQQFNNALKTATQDTGTFAKELLYVDNVQRAFGLNLETTRTGFTKLYASMAPTGFDSGSIEKLFTGISAATAALQLTPDKAERVIYAFGQMASKGQIMSEELKGQLGDVLPGALAIFSKAAGMSVKEFSKAMEDGEFKGQRFREVFAKVSDELMNRFGTGAAAAGKSLQGLLNTVGSDFQRTLESFAPLANSAAQAILGPLGGSLKQLALSAQIATGEIERVFMQLKESQQELKDLRDSAGTDRIITAEEAGQIKAAEANVAALTVKYKSLQQAAGDPAIAKQAQDITKFTEELGKAGTFVMNVAKTIGGILSPVLNFLGGNLTTVISLITTFYIGFQTARLAAAALMGVLLLYRGLAAILGFGAATQQAAALAGAFNVLGVNATRANVALIGTRAAMVALVSATVIGAVVGGIIAIASAFATMKDRAKEAADESKRAVEEGGRAASMGMTMGVTSELNKELAKNRAVSQALKTLENIYAKNQKSMRGGGKPIISVEEMARLKAGAEYSNEIAGLISGNQFKEDGFQINAFLGPDLSRAKQQAGQITAEVRKSTTVLKAQQRQAQQTERELGLNKPDPAATQAEDTLQDTKKTNLESFASLQDQLAKNFTQAEIDRLQALHDQRMALQNEFFNQQEARANSFQKESIKFQRELAAIENERKSALLKASLEAMKAQGSVAGGAAPGVAMAAGGVVAYTGGALSQDPLTRGRSTGAHLHAQAVNITEKTLQYLVDKYLEIGGKAASAFGRSRGAAGHGYNAIDFLTPQNTPVKLKPGASISQYGPAGGRGGLMAQVNTPEGNFQLGHLTSLSPAGAGAPRKVPGSEKRDLIAAQQVQIANSQQITIGLNAEQLAYEKTKTAIANYVASIFSPEEQALQNSLLAKRGELIRAGMDDDAIELEMKRYEIQEKVNIGLEDAKKLLDGTKEGQKKYNDVVAELNKLLPASNKLLAENNALAKDNAYQKRIGDLKETIRLLRIINDDERRIQEIMSEEKVDRAKAQEIFNLEKIKKNIEDTRALIGDFVSSTSSDYKGFLKAVISGEDAADALQQFQEGLKDKVLTIFLDFAMAPVEKFLQDTFEGLFRVDKASEKEKTPEALEADSKNALVEANTNAVTLNTTATDNLTTALSNLGATMVPGTDVAATGFSTKEASQYFNQTSFDAGNTKDMFANIDFETAFEPIQKNIKATLENLSSDFSANALSVQNSAADYDANLSQVGDSANKMAAEAGKAAEEAGKNGKDFQESLGKVAAGVGIAAGTIMGVAAGISQIKKGGTGNTLMGIGSILASVGGGLGGFLKLGKAANGAVWKGGFQAFANGGMVSGPTLGLVGEGKYNEAIVPLPDGRSIPVQMKGAGGGSLREAMGQSSGSNSAPILNMSFQSTTINGVEYVSRDQLEQAMAQTRRQASREGAQRGMSMTLDKIQQSPSTRSRIGIR